MKGGIARESQSACAFFFIYAAIRLEDLHSEQKLCTVQHTTEQGNEATSTCAAL